MPSIRVALQKEARHVHRTERQKDREPLALHCAASTAALQSLPVGAVDAPHAEHMARLGRLGPSGSRKGVRKGTRCRGVNTDHVCLRCLHNSPSLYNIYIYISTLTLGQYEGWPSFPSIGPFLVQRFMSIRMCFSWFFCF